MIQKSSVRESPRSVSQVLTGTDSIDAGRCIAGFILRSDSIDAQTSLDAFPTGLSLRHQSVNAPEDNATSSPPPLWPPGHCGVVLVTADAVSNHVSIPLESSSKAPK
jgi:hypothetical protein